MSLEDAERSRAFSTAAWDEERKALLAANEALRADKLAAETQLADTREEMLRKDEEMGVLKAELEAQWKGTESQTEKITELEKDRGELREEVEALHVRMGEMELDWTQSENRKNELEGEVQELWSTKEDLERERGEVSCFPYLSAHGMLTALSSSNSSCATSKTTLRSSPMHFANARTRSPRSSRNTNSRSSARPESKHVFARRRRSSLSLSRNNRNARMMQMRHRARSRR